jgi:hypothetical protein
MAFFDFQLAGYWNAATNDRGLKSGKGQRGQVYLVSVAGTTVLDGITNWYVSDLVWFDGDHWQVIAGPNRPVVLPSITATSSTYPRTLPDRFAEKVNVKDFGAIGDKVLRTVQALIVPGALAIYASLAALQIDYPHVTSINDPLDWAAMQKAFQVASDTQKAVYIPSGYYMNGTKTVSVPIALFETRHYVPHIIGDGYYNSIIDYTGTDYVFQYPADPAVEDHIDAIHIDGIQIHTTTGGGIDLLGGCGGLHITRFFMHGCATGRWAIHQPTSVVYTGTISECRFWQAFTGYQGGVLQSAHSITWRIEKSFISRQYKNGPIVELTNCNVFSTESMQYEGTGGPLTSVQTFISFKGFCFNAAARDIYIEGTWDKFLSVDTGVATSLLLENIFAWEYDEVLEGKPSPIILDLATDNNNVLIDNVVHLNGCVGAGTGYLINDPYHDCRITNFFNQSSGNQAQRLISQSLTAKDRVGAVKSAFINGAREFRPFSGRVTSTNAGAGVATSFTIFLPTDVAGTDPLKIAPGFYELSLTIRTLDKNHATTRAYYVLFDDASVNDYATVTPIIAAIDKGVPPTALSVTVTNLGVVTVGCTQALPQDHECCFYWRALHNLQ